MTPWERVDAHLTANAARGKSWAWLTRELKLKAAAVGNWKARDIPAKYHAQIASLLGRSTDWVSGAANRAEWPFTLVDQDRYERLSPEAKGAVQLRMTDAIERMELNAKGVSAGLLENERRNLEERRKINDSNRKDAI
jgi:hypothetical protein